MNNQLVSNSLQLERIISHVQTKQKNVKDISYENLMSREWAKNDFVFLVHSFSAWPDDVWEAMLAKIPNNISLVLTEFVEDIELLEKTFNHKKINKIIISVDSAAKFFNKNVKIEKSKIKYIPLLGENFEDKEVVENQVKTVKFYPTIMIPSRLTSDKNYDSILNAIHRLKFKYPRVLAVFLIKINNKDSDIDIIENMNDLIEQLNIKENVNLLVNPIDKYEKYLSYADLVVIPSKSRESLYYSSIVDAIKAYKPIVAPDVMYASDLCKKEAGILLYENELETPSDVAESIADNCSIISDNREISKILAQQNKEMISYFEENKVLPQYVNIIRKLKNSNDTSK